MKPHIEAALATRAAVAGQERVPVGTRPWCEGRGGWQGRQTLHPQVGWPHMTTVLWRQHTRWIDIIKRYFKVHQSQIYLYNLSTLFSYPRGRSSHRCQILAWWHILVGVCLRLGRSPRVPQPRTVQNTPTHMTPHYTTQLQLESQLISASCIYHKQYKIPFRILSRDMYTE